MADYVAIDPVILSWTQKHALTLFTSWAGDEARFVHLSSVAGECFQISIAPPVGGQVTLHARYLEGSKDPGPERSWSVPIGELGAGLEEVVQTVLTWMKPSVRSYPSEPAIAFSEGGWWRLNVLKWLAFVRSLGAFLVLVIDLLRDRINFVALAITLVTFALVAFIGHLESKSPYNDD
jgi:hypothetical protein